ncbi:phage tail terminator family protein [Ruminiclostridium cellulolyticum]|uniref:Phage protein n=1 Tax=Ruminiclostridium cellulolyticum (strain ATCC 35319 / DSM 5812 / JCM 6584 / H10) TaxID=394503 RepID=B8I8E6_RUMCH|nr:hypothetical protein [Ruminiclostridium cellulolyticum]ACL77246.1 conserved hypothetical protein [Ruminiclostridium cellulolyticum H10]
MVTLIDINKAITSKIRQAIADTEYSDVPIPAIDVTESIIRPSIKFSIENSSNGKFNANCRQKTLICRIYFFAKDRTKYNLDNIKMQDILENAFFDGITIKEGFFIPIDNVESEVTDGVLICSFDMQTIESLPDDSESSETMEDLILNLGKGD